jgi:hypothetical protein
MSHCSGSAGSYQTTISSPTRCTGIPFPKLDWRRTDRPSAATNSNTGKCMSPLPPRFKMRSTMISTTLARTSWPVRSRRRRRRPSHVANITIRPPSAANMIAKTLIERPPRSRLTRTQPRGGGAGHRRLDSPRSRQVSVFRILSPRSFSSCRGSHLRIQEEIRHECPANASVH